MARIKFGSIITSGSGSLGGHTIQNSRGGAQLRTKPINKKKPSAAQSLIRSYNPQLQHGWRALTEVQRSEWNAYAVSHQVLNKVHPVKVISGHSLWMSLQFEYISNGLAFQTNVFKASAGPFGSELVTNGSFVDGSGWTPLPCWSISGGYANYDGSPGCYLIQDLILALAVNFRLSFDLANCGALTYFAFRSNAGQWLFNGTPGTWLSLPNGSYYYNVSTITATSQLRVLGNDTGCAFSIDNISIKQIL